MGRARHHGERHAMTATVKDKRGTDHRTKEELMRALEAAFTESEELRAHLNSATAELAELRELAKQYGEALTNRQRRRDVIVRGRISRRGTGVPSGPHEKAVARRIYP